MNVETLSALAEKQIAKSGLLQDFRKSELLKFKARGMKELFVDSYKYTNLETFFSDLKKGEVKVEHARVFNDEVDYPTITFINGAFSDSEILPEGVTLKKISEVPELAKKFFQEKNPLSSLHHSLFGEGVILEVAKNIEVKTPVRILNLISEGTFSAPTHLILAHPFSKLTVVEETRTEGPQANITETYLKAETGSRIEHIILQEDSSEGLNHSSVYADIENDASVRSIILHGSGRMNRTNLIMNVNAPGANAESYSLFLTNGKEHSDINTEINHQCADTTSSQIAKGILDGESQAVFTGKIFIHPKAQRVASGQLNKNLLLSKKAHVFSEPQLEIFADDVKCSHGSTTGQLSDDEVFYFQSRGIPADKARNLLAFGFALEIVDKIENPMAKSHIKEIIMDNLAGKFSLGRSV